MKTPRYLLVLVTLLGVALLWAGVRWYMTRLDRVENPPAAVVAAIPAAADGTSGKSRLRAPNAAELAGISSTNAAEQNDAVNILFKLEMSPEALRKIDEVLAGNPAPNIYNGLLCLKARGPGEERLQLALDWIPTDPAASARADGRDGPGAPCMIEALTFHAAEAPDRIRERLLIVAFSSNFSTRDAAVRALNELPPAADIPFNVQVKASSERIGDREGGVRVALALGALKTLPGLVERAIDDPESQVRRWPLAYLERGATGAEASRMIARMLVREPKNPDRLRLLRAHPRDVSVALADVALDESAAAPERQAALDILRLEGDTAALPMLEPLRTSSDPELQSRAQATALELEQRKARGQ